jgi:hypothetical protein
MAAKTETTQTPAAEMQAATPKGSARGKRAILPARVESAEFKRAVWRAYPEKDTPYETVLSETYWAHRAAAFRRGDLIEVWPDEMHYFAMLLVMAAGSNWAMPVELFKVALKPRVMPARQPEFSVAYRGPHHKYAIVRASDDTIVKDGFAQEGDAELALAQFRPRVD